MEKAMNQNDVSHKEDDRSDDLEEDTYLLNVWSMNLSKRKQHLSTQTKNDFKTWVYTNNRLVKLLNETRAKVSLCRQEQAKKWGIIDCIVLSEIKSGRTTRC